MSYWKTISCLFLLFFFAEVFADSNVEFSQIDEELLLNPPNAGRTSDEVMIYSNVRNKTINKSMDNHFERIENMMFINTVIESESGELAHTDDEC